MTGHLESVKILAKNYRAWAASKRSKGDEAVADRQLNIAENLDAVIAELEELQRITRPIPASYGDLSDLPPELMKELTGIKVDDLEQQLFTIIKTGGGEVDLDAILIEMYRRFKVIQSRKFLQNKLWRMAQKGVIFTIPGRKGVYSAQIAKENDDDFRKTFGITPSGPNPFDEDSDDRF